MEINYQSDATPYMILRHIAIYHHPQGAPLDTFDDIEGFEVYLEDMVNGMRWLYIDKGKLYTTEDGRIALEEAVGDVRLVHDGVQYFKEEVLTGTALDRGKLGWITVPTEKESAALPSGKEVKGRRDEERALIRQLGSGLKTCYSCKEAKKPDQFGKDSQKQDGKTTNCKLCRSRKRNSK